MPAGQAVHAIEPADENVFAAHDVHAYEPANAAKVPAAHVSHAAAPTFELVPAADTWSQGKELWFGTGLAAVLLGSFIVGQRLAAPVSPGPDRRATPAD